MTIASGEYFVFWLVLPLRERNNFTAISINVVGSKHKATRQERKVMWDFF